MDSESKRVNKTVWILLVGFLIVVIGLLFGRSLDHNDSSLQDATDERKSDIIVALDMNLATYSPGVEYDIREVKLIEKDYAVVVLDVFDVVYRALLVFNEEWLVVSYPRVVLSYADFPNIPENIIRSANGVGR